MQSAEQLCCHAVNIDYQKSDSLDSGSNIVISIYATKRRNSAGIYSKAQSRVPRTNGLRPVSKLPDGPQWLFEIKLDGYRAIAVKADGHVSLFSRRRKSFDHHYPLIVEALGGLPDGTVVDEEIVSTIQADQISTCSKLPNFRREAQHIHYFIFDLAYSEYLGC